MAGGQGHQLAEHLHAHIQCQPVPCPADCVNADLTRHAAYNEQCDDPQRDQLHEIGTPVDDGAVQHGLDQGGEQRHSGSHCDQAGECKDECVPVRGGISHQTQAQHTAHGRLSVMHGARGKRNRKGGATGSQSGKGDIMSSASCITKHISLKPSFLAA